MKPRRLVDRFCILLGGGGSQNRWRSARVEANCRDGEGSLHKEFVNAPAIRIISLVQRELNA
ncbi:hypothetical protein CH063_00733 [Colletotrichum higginsianum]|uniref:Uncharacterized protein n=1 Tax=Colletotrichum higginsianum (strain IMI 349063) TaxID=759273 RepID=H1UVG7_COLHI|nr:hypothetical protein CH063_00733 [Colletotrichum higginsianum]